MTEKANNHIPVVSIGMPVYNGEKYIKEALDSLLTQTFTDFELIISDNCSTDNTREICQTYAIKDSRIKYIRQQENIGVALNFEFVLNMAQAEYFTWAASDDFWSENWIELLYNIVSEHQNVAVFGKVLTVNKSSQTIKHLADKQKYNFAGTKFIRRVKYFLTPESMGKANVIYGIYRTQVLRKINILSYRYDYILIFDLLYYLEIKSVPNTFLFKRLHDEAVGNQPCIMNPYWKRFEKFVPISLSLLKEYLVHSNFLEKILIVVAVPVKLLFTYSGLIKKITNNKLRC